MKVHPCKNTSTKHKLFLHKFPFLFLLANLGLFCVAGVSAGSPKGLEILRELEAALVSLADKVRPTVVSLSPYVPPSPSVRRQGMPRGGRPANAGAGVIIDGGKGLIVTNSHVVRGAEKIQVTLHDGKEIVGRIVGADEDTDLAIVKIETDIKLSSAELGDSSNVKVGQLVLAVGNPYGLNDTLTLGIVSGLNRENINLSRYEDFIQTDASINPGNSGGPLLNIKGEIIGINTAIINYAQNIGFAIPSNMAKRVIADLIEFGEVRRGWLGVGIEMITSEMAKEVNLHEGKGVLVNSVFEGDPAYEAGVRVGDFILKIGGIPVNSPNGMIRVIGSITPGQTINLDILREGVRKTISVKLENRKKHVKLDKPLLSNETHPLLGMEIKDLDEGVPNTKEVIIANVLPGSLAAKNGLQPGDRIIALNGENVVNSEEFKTTISQIPRGGSVFLLVLRNNEKLHLALVREN